MNGTSALTSRIAGLSRAVRRTVLLRRRLLAAVCVGVAVLAGLRATAAPPPPHVAVLTAARDLPAGIRLSAGDLEVIRYAEGTAPTSVVDLRRAVGRTLAAPLRAGEPVTDVRLVGDGLLGGYDGELVAVPVRIPDAEAVDLLRVGDRINLVATDPQGGEAEVIEGLPVLALPAFSEQSLQTGPTGLTGRLVVVGTTPELSEKVTDAAVQRFLSFTLTQ